MIIDQNLPEAITTRFRDYSLAVIGDRALIDIRDGLKPVQRKILYAMYDLKTLSDTPRRKCARIAGEVIGKYSEHGEVSAYEALVKLCQDWKIRYPLKDFEGKIIL